MKKCRNIYPLISGVGYAFGIAIMGKVMNTFGDLYAWMIVTGVAVFGAIGMLGLNKLKIEKNEMEFNQK